MSKPPVTPVPPPTPAPPKKSNAALWIILAVVGLVGLVLACLCIVPVLLLPAVHQTREVVRTNVAQDHAREIAQALYKYEEANNRFPPAVIPGKNGAPDQSWRTAILPYMDRVDQDIRSGYDRSVAWDRGANLPLSERNVDGFVSPRATHQGLGYTHFVAVVGTDTVIAANGRGNQDQSIEDGLSNTIVAIEYMDSEIPWSKPEDVSPEKAFQIIKSNKSSQGTVVIFADGHIQKIPHTISDKTLRAMFTKSGGEITF